MTETRSLNRYGPQTTLPTQLSYDGGAYLANTSQKTFVTRYPGTDSVICEVEEAGQPERVANRIQAGSVWINDYNITPAEVPFGGYKQSGLGRENGLQAIEHYTQVKTIYANMGDVPKTF